MDNGIITHKSNNFNPAMLPVGTGATVAEVVESFEASEAAAGQLQELHDSGDERTLDVVGAVLLAVELTESLDDDRAILRRLIGDLAAIIFGEA